MDRLRAVALGLGLALLQAAGTTLAAPAGPLPVDGVAVSFVRDGLVLRGVRPAPHRVRVDGRLVAATPLPSGGLLVERPWQPGKALAVEWGPEDAAQRLDLRAPLRPEPLVLAQWAWPRGGWREGSADEVTALVLSADGRTLAAGTQQGRLALFAVDAPGTAPRWETTRPGRVIRQLAFSPDGTRLFVGEQGPEGRVRAVNAGDGSPLWHWDAATLLGREDLPDPAAPYAWTLWPGIYALQVLPTARGGDLLLAASRSWPRTAGAQGRQARGTVLRLEGATGRVRWHWPAAGPAAQLVTWLSHTEDSATPLLAAPLQLPLGEVPGADGQGAARVALLDLDSGRMRGGVQLPPPPGGGPVTLWRAVGLRPGGGALAVSTEDGRALIYADVAGGWRLHRDWTLVEPLRLLGQTLRATTGSLAATAQEVLFATGATYVPLQAGGEALDPRQTHPRGNAVLAHDWSGVPRWVWHLVGTLQGLALMPPSGVAGPRLALLQGETGAQAADVFNGVTLLALPGGAEPEGERRAAGAAAEALLLWRWPLAGRVSYDALAQGGGHVAVAEAPRRLRGDPRPRGAARLWVLR